MSTLYRKHRPTKFEEAVGQNHIKVTLENEIQANKLAHAYLFCGPRGVGKTTFARLFAKAINCTNRKETESEPCNKCYSCEGINNSKCLDIVEIDAASHTGVDNVRDNIIAFARVMPSQVKYKVFIIDEVHMLSISAFNALLKIIEEPPVYVVFVLCTTETHKVPATIISRCQRFDFKRINTIDLVKKLSFIVREEGIKIDKKILEAIARHSEGYMRDAESLLGQIISISGKEITQEEADLVIPRSDINEIVNLIDSLVKKDAATGIELTNKLIDEGVDLKTFLNDLIETLRRLMLEKINTSLAHNLGLDLGETLDLKLREIGQDLSVSQIIFYIEKFLDTRNKIKDSFIIQLPLEVAIAEICLGSPRPSAGPAQPIMPAVNRPVASTPAPIYRSASQSNLDIDINNIIEKWHEVLAIIKKYNHSLSFILRACQPRGLNGNQLCLAFKYKFHKDRVSDTQIRAVIEKTLYEVYGGPLMIQAIVDELMEVQENIPAPIASVSEQPMNQMDNQSFEPLVSENKANPAENAGGNDAINNILKTFGGRVVK